MDSNSNGQTAEPGSLSWRLSSHPITLLSFLGFRTCTFLLVALLLSSAQSSPARSRRRPSEADFYAASLFVYLFGLLFTPNL